MKASRRYERQKKNETKKKYIQLKVEERFIAIWEEERSDDSFIHFKLLHVMIQLQNKSPNRNLRERTGVFPTLSPLSIELFLRNTSFPTNTIQWCRVQPSSFSAAFGAEFDIVFHFQPSSARPSRVVLVPCRRNYLRLVESLISGLGGWLRCLVISFWCATWPDVRVSPSRFAPSEVFNEIKSRVEAGTSCEQLRRRS
jgi:hypothetical protein